MADTSASMWPRAEEIHRLQMRETRRADLALVGFVGAVGDQIDAELALRRFDRGVHFARRHVVALGVELEVMDQRFHRALHLAALGRHDLVVVDRDRALPFGERSFSRHCFMIFVDWRISSMRMQIAVVTVAVLADRDVEIELGVALVGLRLAQIPRRARAAHHHAGEAPVPGVGQLDHADVDIALLEDAVAGQQRFEIVDRL